MFPALVKEVSSFNKVIVCNPCKNLDPRALRTTLLSDIAHQAQLKNIAVMQGTEINLYYNKSRYGMYAHFESVEKTFTSLLSWPLSDTNHNEEHSISLRL